MPGNRERRRPGHFRICGKCGKRNKSRRVECAKCNEPLRGIPEAIPGKVSAPPPPPRKYRWLVAAAILVAVGAGFLIHQLFRTSTITPAQVVPSAPPPENASSLPASRPTYDPTTSERYARAKSAVERGQRLLARRDFRAAASLLADAAQLVPEDPRVANAYGRALLGMGSRDRALHQFERAARLDTGVAAYRIDYAQALVGAGRQREAAREYEAVNALEPGNVAASEGLLRLQQAQPGAASTGVDLGGAPAAGAPAAGGSFTNEDLARGVRPMRPPSPSPAPLAVTTPSPRPLSVSTPSPRPLSVSSPSPRPLSLSSPSPRPTASPYSGPFASPAPF